jgi:hypothetical protein
MVAIVAAIIAYRNNFGWKPLCLVKERNFMARGVEKTATHIRLSFELWNRRKYPIAIRMIECGGQGDGIGKLDQRAMNIG